MLQDRHCGGHRRIQEVSNIWGSASLGLREPSSHADRIMDLMDMIFGAGSCPAYTRRPSCPPMCTACPVRRARASIAQASQYSSMQLDVLVPWWVLQSAQQHRPSQWHACTAGWPAASMPAARGRSNPSSASQQLLSVVGYNTTCLLAACRPILACASGCTRVSRPIGCMQEWPQ